MSCEAFMLRSHIIHRRATLTRAMDQYSLTRCAPFQSRVTYYRRGVCGVSAQWLTACMPANIGEIAMLLIVTASARASEGWEAPPSHGNSFRCIPTQTNLACISPTQPKVPVHCLSSPTRTRTPHPHPHPLPSLPPIPTLPHTSPRPHPHRVPNPTSPKSTALRQQEGTAGRLAAAPLELRDSPSATVAATTIRSTSG